MQELKRIVEESGFKLALCFLDQPNTGPVSKCVSEFRLPLVCPCALENVYILHVRNCGNVYQQAKPPERERINILPQL